MISDTLYDTIDEIERYRKEMPESYCDKEVSMQLDLLLMAMRYTIHLIDKAHLNVRQNGK